MPGTTISPCLQFVRRVTNAFLKAGGHDATCYPSLRIKHAVPGSVQGEFTIGKHNLNRLSTLHGGLICSLVDTMGSLALASKGLYSTGVSTDIHTTFVKAAGGDGDQVKVEGKVTSLGESKVARDDLDPML
jgi:acyl-coenzyme A thioesterase 13